MTFCNADFTLRKASGFSRQYLSLRTKYPMPARQGSNKDEVGLHIKQTVNNCMSSSYIHHIKLLRPLCF